MTADVLRTEQDAAHLWPRWFVKLAQRIGKLERGHVYTLTIVMAGDEPTWTVQTAGKLENTPRTGQNFVQNMDNAQSERA